MNNIPLPSNKNKSNSRKGFWYLIGGFIILIIWINRGDEPKQQEIIEAKKVAFVKPLPTLNEQLNAKLNILNNPIRTADYSNDIASLVTEVELFTESSKLIIEASNSSDKANKLLGTKLRNKIITSQIREFPKIRRAYGKIAAGKLWEEDIYATVSGKNSTTLNLTGGIFAANKNIQETQQTLQALLTKFRFKQVRYRWYEDQDEYTYYDLKSPKDNDLL